MNTPPLAPARLTPEGAARRAEILALAQRAVRGRARRRAAERASFAAIPIALGVGTAVMLARPPAVPPGAPIATDPPPTPADAFPASVSLVRFIDNDPHILDRLAIHEDTSRVETLDDRALVEALASAGLPAGVIRTPDRVLISPLVRASRPPAARPGDHPGAIPGAPAG